MAVVTALCSIGASPASAQLFSPGILSKAHKELEGIDSCNKCHAAGKQVDSTLCLGCHKELAHRLELERGYHASIPAAERVCEKCHAEHLGLDNSLIDFGKAGKKAFDHQKTGWPLAGAHQKVECAKCHQDRLIKDAAVVQRRKKWPQSETLLGLSTACKSCHFDEHRGQLGVECETCHDIKSFKPPSSFDHGKAAFPLTGAHQKVACAKCHEAEDDRSTAAGVFPSPMSTSFARYKPIDHGRCTDCHADPHDGRFGRTCTDCHVTDGWRKIVAKKTTEQGFHDKTRFPLRGEHEDVRCRSCHGPLPGKAAKFKGLPFARCDSCHYDAHAGQLAKTRACEDCHDVDGFKPVKFDVTAHASTRYPLEGAHRVVACGDCHASDPSLERRFPAALAKLLRKQRRPKLFSDTALESNQDTSRCDSCHKSVHGDQFKERIAAKGCQSCHGIESFHAVTFDHDKESRFPLTGSHARAACAACHLPSAQNETAYRGTPMECRGCHRDEHRGQFDAGSASAGRCESCHTTEKFAPSTFDHQDPKRTPFALDGQHSTLACERCHTQLKIGTILVRRYRPLPADCAGCHVDVHQGAMKRFER